MTPAHKLENPVMLSTFHVTDDLERGLRVTVPSGYPTGSASTLCSNGPYNGCCRLSPPQKDKPLPSKQHTRVYRYLRYNFLAVYRRLVSFVFLLNLVALILILCTRVFTSVQTVRGAVATAASSNILIAILIRQDYMVNAIFRSAWLASWRLPLRVRRCITKCYCYGGIHSGAAVAGTMWYFAYTAMTLTEFARDGVYTVQIIIITLFIMGLLSVIVGLAMPGVRNRWHNTFELTHRLLGWALVALFWIQLGLSAAHTSNTVPGATVKDTLFETPTFYNLVVITAMVIYPWICVRRWTFTADVLSSHALRLYTTKTVHKFSVFSLSKSPLMEWHPFAVFPGDTRTATKPDGTPEEPFGTSMVISSAGDWTRGLIQHATSLKQKNDEAQLQRRPEATLSAPLPRLRLWIRTTPKAGVLSLSTLFPRVLIVTTGSGIGPSLSSLLYRPEAQNCHLVWSTRSPAATYGTALLDVVLRADPEAVIIDTDATGRPDLVQVAWREAKRMKGGPAEAVFVLSNAKVTDKVVGGLVARGMPAFGPIFDS